MKSTTKATMCDRILSYLKEGHTLTKAEAVHKLGIYCLAQRIMDLRRMGHHIEGERVTAHYDDGGHATYVRYYLVVPAEGSEEAKYGA